MYNYRFFVCVIRTFKTYYLSHFQICNMVLLTVATKLYFKSSRLIYNWKFVPFDHLNPFCSPQLLQQPLICSLFLCVWYSLSVLFYRKGHGSPTVTKYGMSSQGMMGIPQRTRQNANQEGPVGGWRVKEVTGTLGSQAAL